MVRILKKIDIFASHYSSYHILVALVQQYTDLNETMIAALQVFNETIDIRLRSNNFLFNQSIL